MNLKILKVKKIQDKVEETSFFSKYRFYVILFKKKIINKSKIKYFSFNKLQKFE